MDLKGREGTKGKGTIILVAEELSSLKDEVTLKLGGSSVGVMSCCVFPPTVFYTLSKVNEANKYVVVHRSETVPGPETTWKPLVVSVRSLCNGDLERGLKVDCYEEKYNGAHKLVGTYHTNLRGLLDHSGTGGVKLGLSGKVSKRNHGGKADKPVSGNLASAASNGKVSIG